MSPFLISCIVPVFNGERYLREAIESIFNQTYGPLEVIIADDGSTDRTAAVAASYGEQVSYLRQTNTGPAAARNLGLSAAHGEFLAFLDADDLWHPEKLARQMARFAARPELDLCVTHVQNFWSTELNAPAVLSQDHRLTQSLPGYVTETLLARRTLFDTVGQFDPTLGHADNTEWFLRAAEHGAVIELLADVLVYRRLHKTNLSRREASASREEYVRLVKASLDRRRRQNEAAPANYQFPTPTRYKKA
jgi:glycosyltransferase involved in cell wall biosynthesis